MESSHRCQDKSLPICLLDGIRKIYESERYTDVTVYVENQPLACHRVILSAVSGYFDAMFSSGMKESCSDKIALQNISLNVFEEILAFIYKGKEIVNHETAEEVLQAASMLQMDCLQAKCEQFMIHNIETSNCLGIWKLGKVHNCQMITKCSRPFILEHFSEIADTEDFLRLEKDDVLSLIQDENLNVVNEEIVCESVFKWIKKDESRRKSALPELFPCLRLSLMSLDYILDIIDSNPMVHSFDCCSKKVKDAIKYHALPARRQNFPCLRETYRRNVDFDHVLTVIGRRTKEQGESVDFICYSFVEMKWFSLQSLPRDTGEDFAVCSFGDDIFITGGTKNLQSCLRYTARFGQWKERAELNIGRYRHSVVAVRNSLYVLGGYNFGTLGNVEEYDIGADTWKHVGELKIAVDASSAACLGDKIYVFGGWLGFAEETSAVQCFDTRTYTSTHVTNLPSACKSSNAITFNNRIHVITPQGEVISFSENGDMKIVTVISDFSRTNFGLCFSSDGLFILGGESNHSDNDVTEGCSDVLYVGEKDLKSDDYIQNLPVPMKVYGCIRTVLRKKYPLVDFEKMY